MNDRQPCTRQALEGYILQSVAVTINNTGCGEDVIDRCDLDLEAVDEYTCSNCLDYWPVHDKYNAVSRAVAWQAALDHLKVNAQQERSA